MPDRTMPDAALVDPILHRAARVEDAVQEFRERRARARGLVPTVVPYTGYGAPGWVRVLCRVLLTRRGLASDASYEGVRGWRSFTSVAVDDVEVTVTAGGATHRVQADRGGVVDTRVPLDLEPGWQTVTLAAGGSRPVHAPVFVVDPSTRFGVVSDVDDTIMVTSLPRPFLAAWNSFVLTEHARRPVPGMSVLYERILGQHPGAPVVYLSTGAWNVAPTLNRFLTRNMYPPGALLLTDWGPTHDRFFRSGRLHKQENLRRLAADFPDVQWLLVGDDGQHDEELYGEFVAEHEGKVSGVAIRQLSTSEAVLAGGRSRAQERSRNSAAPWVYAPDGAGLWEALADVGITRR
ncbi:ACP synthase [Curtobacterium sp. MCBD17_034]|uniref:App1 family protein n=1 Tax=unclassified Curtobacterium TaxID=257496 RepID=UPI000DA84A1E|nr:MULTISPECIES: phosphatase domain-containing protein [unclassified Curtobacterium]PZF61023.1 ACP synthase [Curtobacterium sp. MCBD17_034]PZM40373.1 ACP synthase [Curtobacterium sp. MCBD17_031]